MNKGTTKTAEEKILVDERNPKICFQDASS